MMIGSNYELDVYLGQNSIAKISLANDQLFWHYHQSWQQSGYAISPFLPLGGEISPLNVQRFLRNLLPEGNSLDELVSHLHLSKLNTFGLIQALGMDVTGALMILGSNYSLPSKPTFRIITDNEMQQRLNTREEFSLAMWDGKPRLSVAGVQEKINVVVAEDGQLGFGEGTLCSTHILKFEKKNVSHLVLNEYITMQLARLCGLSVANVKLLHFGKHSALLVERFDRQFLSINEVKRRHIIDGCQALNLPPEYKYERNFGSSRDVAHIRDGASLVKIFDFANQCENPALTKQKMLDWVLFNLLVYNYDAHGKNISFFVGSEGVSLTPFYDLVNIKMYPDFDQEMAMALGDEFEGNVVNAYQLADFSDSCHLSRSALATRLKYIIKKLMAALQNESGLAVCYDSEDGYWQQYQKIVYKRCEYLLNQADSIVTIHL